MAQPQLVRSETGGRPAPRPWSLRGSNTISDPQRMLGFNDLFYSVILQYRFSLRRS